ncbi:MAG: DUF262 domain-containing protein [Fibrobacter sp.]|nr:DUF262 domain-containing protein [Fibrobacter sp.]
MITYKHMSIYEAVKKISHNCLVIPAFQRSYVWTTDQVACLWDSILSDYPISTFLFWKINEEYVAERTVFYQFIHEAEFRNGRNLSEHTNDAQIVSWQNIPGLDSAVLDGQQRLTSLYITLNGFCSLIKGRKAKYAGNDIDLCIQLNKDALRDENDSEVQTKYDIAFYENKNLSPTLFRIKDIFKSNFQIPSKKREEEIENILQGVPTASRDYARAVLNKLCEKIYDDDKIIQYQEISDNEDAALDMFIRFNNGGTRLTKSEIGEAMIETFWPEAYKYLSQVCYYKRNKSYDKYLDKTLKSYHNFGLDFIIRLSKVLFEDNINANINSQLARRMRRNWETIKVALKETEEFLSDIRKIHVEDFNNRWNILIPVIYLIYEHIRPDGENFLIDERYKLHKQSVEAYLSRAILFKYYSSGTTGKLTHLKKQMNAFKQKGLPCITFRMLNEIPELRVTDEKIDNLLELQKGNVVCELALRLISSERIDSELSFNSELEYDVDHIHPRKRFEGKAPEGVRSDLWEKWGRLCEEMPNLSMLNSSENRDVKNDLPLNEYIQQKSASEQCKYKLHHFIPDTDLNLSNFGTFFEMRKAFLRTELEKLLHKEDSDEQKGIRDLTDQEIDELGNLDNVDEILKTPTEGEFNNW